MQHFENDLRDWLVDLIEISTSIGFNNMDKATLSER